MQEKQLFEATYSGVGTTIETHKVLKNTYLLLSMTLLFSAVTAAASIALNIGYGPSMIMSLVGIGLLWFVLPRTQNSAAGIWVTFAFTGLMGASLGPMLSHYLSVANGPALIAQALGGTAVIFLGLSGYALTTRKDFSFMGGFLIVGLLTVLVTMLGAFVASFFFSINFSALHLAMSAAILLIMSGLILYQTSEIIHGGETNYISATVSLYLSILNIFTSLLHLLGAMDD